MPHKLRPLALVNFRHKLSAALVAAFALALFAGPSGDAARAQRRRQQPAASQQGANSNAAPAQRTARTKRVFVGQGGSSAQGSRQTIKSDDSLNDYSAYRSGDRFYVVLPKADASSVARGGAGKGYSDMQVQQRGNDVVLSYRLQPGAKPRVEQKFNRLDVVFDVPEGAQQPAAGQAARNAPQNTPPADQRNTAASNQPSVQTQGQTASQAAGASHGNAGHADPRAAAGQSTQPSNTAQQPSPVNAPPGAVVPQPLPTAEAPAVAAQTPAATPAAESKVALARSNFSAPVPGVAVATEAPTGATLGAALVRNWPLTLIVALLLVVGVGLLFMARRTSAAPRPAPEEEFFEEEKTRAAPLAEKRAAQLKAESASAKPVPVPVVKAEDKSTAVLASVPLKEEEPKAAETAVAEETAAAEPSVEEVAAESPVKEIAVAESPAEAKAASEPERVTGEIVPVVDLGPDRVHREVSRLLEGEGYEGAVVGTKDPMARQMIAAELLSALAGRNDARRERARTAFVEHGYFEETARDLRGAEAPAERAAAARSLGLAGDRAATPHLVAALEDRAVEVRRAAVEALASLRDPAALAPLESLLEREKKAKTKVNRKVVVHAVEACRAGQADDAAKAAGQQAAAEPTAPEVEPAALSTEPAESRELAPFTEPSVVEAAQISEAPAETTIEATPVEATTAEITPFVDAPQVEAEPEALTVETPAAEPVASVEPAAEAEAQPLFEAEPSSPWAEEVGEVEEVAAAEPEAEPVEAVSEVTLAVEPPAEVEAAEPVREEAETAVAEEEAQTIEVAALPALAEEVAEVEEPAAVEDAPLVEEEATVEVPAAEAAPAESLVAETEESPVLVETEEVTAVIEQEEPIAAAEPEAFGEREAFEERLAETHEAIEPEVTAPEVEPAVAESAGHVGSEPAAEAEPQPLFEQQTWLAEEPASPEPAAEVAAPARPAAEEAAGEWFEFDMGEVGQEASQTTEVEPYAQGSAGTTFEPESREIAPAAEAVTEAAAADVTSIAPFVEQPAARPSDERQETGIVARGETYEITSEVPAATAAEKGIEVFDEFSTVPASIQHRLASRDTSERAEAVSELARYDTPDTFHQICAAFDDEAREVRSAAARALFELRADRADSFTRALRESSPERRHNIGTAISASGLASEAISQLTGESREKTYEAFSLLFLMAKAGEVQPLIRAIEGHPSNDVRLAVVKLLALSGQREILPAFRRLAVRGSLPTEVRSAVMEAIYQISSGQPTTA